MNRTYAYPARIKRDEDGRLLVQFRDLPECLTDGATIREALSEARDALAEAVMARILDEEEIPEPSRIMRGEHLIALDAEVAFKAALYEAKKSTSASAAEIARRLNVEHREVRRMLDPEHHTRLHRMTDALDVLDHEIVVMVRTKEHVHT